MSSFTEDELIKNGFTQHTHTMNGSGNKCVFRSAFSRSIGCNVISCTLSNTKRYMNDTILSSKNDQWYINNIPIVGPKNLEDLEILISTIGAISKPLGSSDFNVTQEHLHNVLVTIKSMVDTDGSIDDMFDYYSIADSVEELALTYSYQKTELARMYTIGTVLTIMCLVLSGVLLYVTA